MVDAPDPNLDPTGQYSTLPGGIFAAADGQNCPKILIERDVTLLRVTLTPDYQFWGRGHYERFLFSK
jgi:hypothetical protein